MRHGNGPRNEGGDLAGQAALEALDALEERLDRLLDRLNELWDRAVGVEQGAAGPSGTVP